MVLRGSWNFRKVSLFVVVESKNSAFILTKERSGVNLQKWYSIAKVELMFLGTAAYHEKYCNVSLFFFFLCFVVCFMLNCNNIVFYLRFTDEF